MAKNISRRGFLCSTSLAILASVIPSVESKKSTESNRKNVNLSYVEAQVQAMSRREDQLIIDAILASCKLHG